VLTAVVIRSGEALQVRLVSSESSEEGKEFDPSECSFEPEASNPTEWSRPQSHRPRDEGTGMGRGLVYRVRATHAFLPLPEAEKGHGLAIQLDPRRSRER